MPRAKYLLKKYHEVEKYKELNDVCEKQLSEYKQLSDFQAGIIKKQSLAIKNDSIMFVGKEYILNQVRAELKVSQKETRVQKTYKWIAIGSGIFVTGLFGYYVATH
jgi:hypothetical protein